MYFQNFPDIIYDFDINGTTSVIQVKDITRNIRFRRDVLANITIYDEYDVIDGETPEHVAEKFYGNPEYHWVVMLINEVYDYKQDWVLSYNDLSNYIKSKYNDVYGIHHYQLNGYVVDEGTVVNGVAASPVTNYDYEVTLNETKRRIKIVPEIYISKIISDYNKLI